MSHATRVLPLASCHAVAHTGTMTYQHMNQTEPCNQGQATRYRVQYPDDEGWTRTTTVDFPTLCDNGCGSATDDPEGQAWHDETCPSCHAMILDAGGMIHRMGY